MLTYKATGGATYNVQTKGTLAVEGGCVALRVHIHGHDEGIMGLIWPGGVTVDDTPDGRVAVLTSDQKVAAEIGAKAKFGGGGVAPSSADAIVLGGIPPTCVAKRYFQISSVLV